MADMCLMQEICDLKEENKILINKLKSKKSAGLGQTFHLMFS